MKKHLKKLKTYHDGKKLLEFDINGPLLRQFLKRLEDLKNVIRNLEKEIKITDEKKAKNFWYKKEKEEIFFRKLDSFFRWADQIEGKIQNENLIRGLKKLFRTTFVKYLFQSKFAKRGLLKPRGYPGDYKIIEAMYDNVPVSRGIGLLFDKYFLKNDYVEAVRDRKDTLKKYLKNYINTNVISELKILNLACGSCREIRENSEFLKTIDKDISFTLVDQDKQAIKFAENKLKAVSMNIKLKFVENDVLNFVEAEKSKRTMKYNLIYSIGLADYLPDSYLGPFVSKSIGLLASKGEFIIAHKNTEKFHSPVSDWAADWKFIPRTKLELLKLIKKYVNLTDFTVKVITEPSKRVFYIIFRK